MIEAYTLGAVFTIKNEASAALQQITRELTVLNGELTKAREALQGLIPTGLGRRMEGVSAGLTAISDGAAKAASGFGVAATDIATASGKIGDAAKGATGEVGSLGRSITAAMGGADTSINATIERLGAVRGEIESLSTQMREVSAMSIAVPQIASPTGGGGGRGYGGAHIGDRGSHGGGDLHFSGASAPIPGGHVRIGGSAALAAAGIFGYGVLEEAEIEDQVSRIMATSQLPLGKDMMGTPQAQLIRKMIQDGAAQTGFSPKEVGEAMLGTEREFQGLSFEKRMEVMKTLMPYAGAEARLRESDLKTSFETLVGLMHMSGGFKPEDLPELARAFSFTSMTTPVSLSQFRNALSYPMSTLHEGLGMDPSTVMFLTSMMQTAGIQNTKAGTWLRSFFQQSEPDTPALGPLNKQQVQHNEALKRLGLIDGDNHVTWQVQGADGKIDWMQSVIKMSEMLNANLAKLPTDDKLEIIHKAFGQQGGGFATLMQMNSFIEQMPIIAEKMKAFKGGEDVLSALGQSSTVMQAREAWRDTQNVLMDIGKTALPSVNEGLQDFDKLIKSISLGVNDKNWGDFWHQIYDNMIKPDLGPLAKVLPVLPHGDPSLRPMTQEEKTWRMWHQGQEPPPGMFSSGVPAANAYHVPSAYNREAHARAAGVLSNELEQLEDRARANVWTFGQLDTQTGVVKTSFGGLDDGSKGLKSSLEILTQTAMGAARALATVALNGGVSADDVGGGSGFIRASYEGGGFGGGSAGGAWSGGSAGGSDGAGYAHHAAPSVRYGRQHSYGEPNPYDGAAGDGSFVPPGPEATTAGMRQNNLGNLGYFPGMHYAGLIGPSNTRDVDHTIARFATQEDGIRAAAALALRKYESGRHDAWDMIAAAGGWTPGALGPSASVNVARAMGLTNHDDLHLDRPDQMVKFLHGLAMQEHGAAGRWYSEDRIRSALDHAKAAGVGSIPGHIDGTLKVGDNTYRYGSGGVRGSAHIPYGDFPINPDSGNPWGRAHNAMDVNGNGSIWDQALGRMRTGIEMHEAHSANMVTEGCLAFLREQYPQLKAQVRDMIAKHGHAYLHVGPDGASITPNFHEPPKRAAVIPPPPPHTPTPGPRPHRDTPMPEGSVTSAALHKKIDHLIAALGNMNLHSHLHLDGREIASNVTRHQMHAARFASHPHYHDDSAHYAHPDTAFG